MIPRRKYDIEENLFAVLSKSLLTGKLIDGADISRFELEFARKLSDNSGNKVFAVATSSGRSALLKLLKGLKTPKTGKILIPSYTLSALVPFLAQHGYSCKACDVGKSFPLLEARHIEKAMSGDVSTILVTHLFGYLCEIEEIMEIAERHNVQVIEDCAHCLGSTYNSQATGTFGDGALFSFDILKTVNTFGGGMSVTPHQNVATQIADAETSANAPSQIEIFKKISAGLSEQLTLKTPLLRLPTGMLAFESTKPLMDLIDSKLRRPSTTAEYKRYSNLQAILGIAQLASIEERVYKKRRVARLILETLKISDEQINGTSHKKSNAYYLVLKAAKGENAANLRKELWFKGIDAGFASEIADDLGAMFSTHLKNSADWFERAIQLPCYSSMSDKTLDKLLYKLKAFRGRLVKD